MTKIAKWVGLVSVGVLLGSIAATPSELGPFKAFGLWRSDAFGFARGWMCATPSGSAELWNDDPRVGTPGCSRSSPSANPEAEKLPPMIRDAFPTTGDSLPTTGDSLPTTGDSLPTTADSAPTKWVNVNSRGFQPTVKHKESHDPEGVAPSAKSSNTTSDSLDWMPDSDRFGVALADRPALLTTALLHRLGRSRRPLAALQAAVHFVELAPVRPLQGRGSNQAFTRGVAPLNPWLTYGRPLACSRDHLPPTL
jgi:hypothetical protein